MLERGDGFVYVLIVLLIVIWLWGPWKRKPSVSSDVPSSGKLVKLLKDEGYEIVSGKLKMPLTLHIGERETDSVISADLLVKQHGRTYAVKVEREEGESITAKRVRERYLPVCLAFRTDGVVIINAAKTRVKHVDISVRSPLVSSRLRWGLTSFLLGVGVTFFWLY